MRITIIALACLLGGSTASVAEVVLAEGGRALMPVVIAEGATERQRELADELAALLERISGAAFEVTTGDGSSGVVLGTPEQFPQPRWRQALRVAGHDGVEAYGIRSQPSRLLVIGATDLGLDRGITRVLEALGCRWFFPSEAWHIIPRLDRLAINLGETDRPAMLSRVIWWDWGFWDARAKGDWGQWQRRNRMGEGVKVSCGHSWQRIIRERQAEFDAHPEYLALRPVTDEEGETTLERGGHKFCISNPGLVELCVEWALDYLREDADADMVSMEPSDGGGHCECDECVAMGSIPERVHGLVNAVAKAVGEEFPERFVGTLAYNEHSEPPSFPMEPNVYVQVTAGFTRGRFTFLELIDEWSKHVDQLGVYEYLAVWAWGRDMPGRPRGSNISYVAEKIPYYASRGATTMSCESGANYGVNGLGYLVASRLMWDPDADVAAICEDFYESAFGPAAEPMRRVYERLDGGSRPLLSDHLLALTYRDVAEATELAAGRPDVLARLDDVKLYLRYVGLMRDLETSQGDEARLAAAFPVLNLAYRSRHRYVVHSPAIRSRLEEYYLRGIEQPPEWDWRNVGAETAWWVGEDYTPEEVDALFQEGLARYQIQEFEERTFGDDLVHAGFAPSPNGVGRFVFQNVEPLIAQSLEGEPIEFRLMTGVIAHYRDRRPTQWSVVDAAGGRVAGGELPLDGEWHEISADVPGRGTYDLDINDFGVAWQIESEAGKPYVWVPEKGRRAYSMGSLGSLHFYVPEGTKRIAYFVEGSGHSVMDGDGNEVARIEAQPGNVVVVDVPEGTDGRAWCIKGLSRTQLWFYNCPNIIAARAEDLLVPRELIGRDAATNR